MTSCARSWCSRCATRSAPSRRCGDRRRRGAAQDAVGQDPPPHIAGDRRRQDARGAEHDRGRGRARCSAPHAAAAAIRGRSPASVPDQAVQPEERRAETEHGPGPRGQQVGHPPVGDHAPKPASACPAEHRLTDRAARAGAARLGQDGREAQETCVVGARRAGVRARLGQRAADGAAHHLTVALGHEDRVVAGVDGLLRVRERLLELKLTALANTGGPA